MTHDEYDRILSDPMGAGPYTIAFGIVRREYPNLTTAKIDEILDKCGLSKRRCSCCGYQGSMSPRDYEKLKNLLSEVQVLSDA
jgi:hypothetical protein